MEEDMSHATKAEFLLNRRSLIVGAAALAAPAILARPAFAVTPADIKAKGKIVIGIQGDNPPWGYVDTSGKQDGFDADIGKLFASELGVAAEFTPLAVANRIPALTAGRVDILRFDDDAATIQALISGQVTAVGGNMFYLQKIEQAKPGLYENSLEFTRLYNGACTRLGEKEINAAANAFIDKIKGNGELAKAYAKWMKVPVPDFPDHVDGVPFAAT